MKARLIKSLDISYCVLGIATVVAFELQPHSLLDKANRIYNLKRQLEENERGDWNSTKGTNRPVYVITDPQVLSLIEAMQAK